MPDGTVCNPAFLPEAAQGALLIRLYLGNGYAAFSTAQQLLYEPISKEFLRSLFEKKNVTSVEANTGMVFTSKYLQGEFSPYRMQYVSEIRNPNYPVVAIHAAVERRLQFSGGLPVEFLSSETDSVTVGARARLLNRRFVHSAFSLVQALSERPNTLIPVKTQTAVFLDPFVGWVHRSEWTYRLSLGVVNVGSGHPSAAEYPDTTDLQLGAGLEIPLPVGRVRVGLDLADVTTASSLDSRVRLGAGYRLANMELMAGYNINSVSAGVTMGSQLIRAGIAYEFSRADYEGESFESKIATELSVHF